MDDLYILRSVLAVFKQDVQNNYDTIMLIKEAIWRMELISRP
jgi:hypothetical protein